MKYNILGELYEARTRLPFKRKFKPGELVHIDLSDVRCAELGIESVGQLEAHVKETIAGRGAAGAFGGYGESRSFYRFSPLFGESHTQRTVHLGVDFWLPAGTAVAAPLPGLVHSFANNNRPGDYGPTLILQHFVGNHIFYSLYGHLCLASMGLWKEGSLVQGGAVIGYLGESHENVGWPPHLHFQLMKSLEGMAGDYPGVCHQSQAEAYFENCPNPLVVFGKPWISKLYGSVGA